MSHSIEVLATALFAAALLHTFLANRFEHAARRRPANSVGANLLHLLGEVEVVFGLWATLFVVAIMIGDSTSTGIHYLESLDFREPTFVFVVMAICATRPIHDLANSFLEALSRVLPFHRSVAFYFVCLSFGPLFGSFITEPAAMTLCALVLKERYFEKSISNALKYATLALLFVNISIGGTLTHFAAPPVLMVAGKWNWGLSYLFAHFGWKAAVAVFMNTTVFTFYFRRELKAVKAPTNVDQPLAKRSPAWLIILHVGFLALAVASVHHSVIVMGIFLLFLGVTNISQKYQRDLALKNALLVGFFLAGLVVLGSPQHWWLKPLLEQMQSGTLFLGATALTAITDNAAITFLAAQSEGLTQASKYAVLAGAVTGGGLTVIANAPNPAGLGILKSSFGDRGVNALSLFIYALIPTVVAALCFWFLPSWG